VTTPDTAKCACGHLVSVHQLVVRKDVHRGRCTHLDQQGQCQCAGPR
jgi:hypothetical protein